MARTSSKRAALLVASLMLGAIASSVPGARAHGPDAAGWLEQAGDGKGASKPVISDLKVSSILYDARRFMAGPFADPRVPTQPTTHIAYGTRPVSGGQQVFIIRGGSDGISWGTPEPLKLQDPSGQDLPLIIGNPGSLDVEYLPDFSNIAFRIWYTPAGSDGADTSSISSADSDDGVNFYLDLGSLESTPGSVVGGTGFKSKIIGPADVRYLSGGNITAASCAPNPFNCETSMTYTTADPDGKRYSAVAYSLDQGVTWTGFGAAALSPGSTGAWDDHSVATMTVERLSASSLRALYSGAKSGGAASIGWASSTNGLTWSKVAADAVTKAALFDAAAKPDGVGSLVRGQFLPDTSTEHRRTYVTRTVASKDYTYVAYTSPAPGAAPHVRVASPTSGAVIGPKVPLTVFAGDTLGSPAGLDMQSLSVTIDGVPVPGITFENTIVGQYTSPGKKIMALPALADGAHTLVVSIPDLEANTTSVTVDFTVDGVAPNSTITSAPTDIMVGFLQSIGKVSATTVDPAGGTGIEFVSAIVTNPLGQVKAYSTHNRGWQVSKTNANSWNVSWIAPGADPHFIAPGEYRVSILGTDVGGNQEKADAANSVTILVA